MNASLIAPMLLLQTEKLLQGAEWTYGIRLDGYRAIAFKKGGNVQLRSRNDNDFSARYRSIAEALMAMPDNTVLDAEVVALNEEGKPSFNLLQNYGPSKGPLVFFIFDVLVLSGCDVMTETLDERRTLLEKHVLAKPKEPIRVSPELNESLADLIASVKAQGFEALVAKKHEQIRGRPAIGSVAEDAGQSRPVVHYRRIYLRWKNLPGSLAHSEHL